jgi:hypothetical protein
VTNADACRLANSNSHDRKRHRFAYNLRTHLTDEAERCYCSEQSYKLDTYSHFFSFGLNTFFNIFLTIYLQGFCIEQKLKQNQLDQDRGV